MHQKIRKAREAAGFVYVTPDRPGFRLPDPSRKTGPPEERMHALLSDALLLMLRTPEYQQSGIAILEMGVVAGKVRKRVMRSGLIEYSYAMMAAKPNCKRG
jgi:hypothetical protein